MPELYQALSVAPEGWPVHVTAAFSALTPGAPRTSLGFKTDPAAPEVLAARKSWLAGLGFDPAKSVFADQVHGVKAALAETRDGGAGLDTRQSAIPATDALLTQVPGMALSVTTADCLPVLITNRDGRAVAAVHAGWRGMAGGILENTVAGFSRFGIPPSSLLAVLGPCISAKAYEVGDEFTRYFPSESLQRVPGGRWHFDLQAEAKRRLFHQGLSQTAVAAIEKCTYRDRGLFFSNRRDGGVMGLMLSTIGIHA